ncbi:hypothetical protein CPC08DRAFT_707882 [Agrocybe pediades]|nr:hypothetical protein CPC08DRAFT_707882 [Agrocybe pediades]
MVHAATAVVFAAVAFNAVSTLAMPTNDNYDLMERDYDNFDEFDARELYDFEDFDAREFDDEVMEVREPFHFHRHHRHATATVTVTSTHTPRPTSCTKKENEQHDKQAKKAKEAAKKAKKDREFKEKMAKKYGLLVPPTSTSSHTSASATSSVHSTTTASSTASHSTITPAPTQLKAVPGKLSVHTVTHHGTVTVKVTTTAARPACTKASGFKKLFRHHHKRSVDGDDVEEMMSREFEVDELD